MGKKIKQLVTVENFRKNIQEATKLAHPFFLGLAAIGETFPVDFIKKDAIRSHIEDLVKNVLRIYVEDNGKKFFPCSAASGYIKVALDRYDNNYALDISIELSEAYRKSLYVKSPK